METAHLKAFLRIAETGSITRAADSLGVAQPSLSQQLLRLEDEIGFRLFERIARGVILTEAGRLFREHARQILHRADQAVADGRQLRDEAPGHVVFAMPPSLLRLVGAPLVRLLAERAPRVRLHLVEAFTGSIRGWLEAEKIDLGVLYDLGALRHLSTRRLASDPLVAVGGPGRAGTDLSAGIPALGGERLILPSPRHGLRLLLDREASRRGVELDVAYEIDAVDTALDMAAQGLGTTVLPACVRIRDGLAAVPIGDPPLRRALCLARNPAHVLTRASVMVESELVGLLADMARSGAWSGRLEAE